MCRARALAGGVRSDVLFSILDGLRAADMPLAAYPGIPPAAGHTGRAACATDRRPRPPCGPIVAP